MSSAKPRERKCANCRFYEQSPLWRRGWCRNPLLYDPQTNHLVEADTLACRRTFIDYWEARRPGQQGASADPPDLEPHLPKVRRAPSIPLTPTGPGGAPLRGNGATVAAMHTTANLSRERAPQLSLVKPATRPLDSPPPPGDPHADTAALPRLTPAPVPATPPVPAPAPSNGVVVGRPEPAIEDMDRTRIRRLLLAGVILATIVFVVVYQRPHLGFFGAAGTGTPTPTLTQAAQAFSPPLPTNTRLPPATATPPPPPTAVPTAKPLVLAIGANAQLSGLNAGNLNVRQSATTKARVLGVLRNNVTVKIVAGPQTADGITWWQITGWDAKNTPGWASAKYLKPVP
jgi:hypothetical protein